LDVTIQAQVVALIKNLCAEKNIACLFITHDLGALSRLTEKVFALEDGQLKNLRASKFWEVLQWN
ncbi:MAG: hypothetical protein IJR52_12585, partial [Selenomonadaceae bacterium]|nr:hypothetical protein [Selenomonadaceae bacterium]